MKLVFVLFDSLNRKALEPYGGSYVKTPNFNRFAEKAITFDRHYVGSLPCMPARRDMHTGRINFLHRNWGPLEPFDNSFPDLIKSNGGYGHIITDHYHYFHDGGATYHTRYNSWEIVRGASTDDWKGIVEPNMEKISKNYHFGTFSQNPESSRICTHFTPILHPKSRLGGNSRTFWVLRKNNKA